MSILRILTHPFRAQALRRAERERARLLVELAYTEHQSPSDARIWSADDLRRRIALLDARIAELKGE